jgi:phage terminase Nu1 subunit (DNA packaging protein)
VPWHHVGRQQLAQLMGVHPDSVTDFTRGGMPVITRGGHGKESSYDAIACLAWWRAQQGQNAKEAAQARAANASAELNELKLKEKAGELWPKSAIAVAGQAVVKQVATTLRALPRRMTQAGLIQREQEAEVTTLLTDVLRTLMTWRPIPEDAP